MGFQIFLTFFLVFLNGFFVAAEFAIVKVRASQIEIKVKTGNRIARIAKHITQHLDGYLAATQLGITLASLGLGWVGERVMEEVLHNLLLTFGASPETIVSFSGTAAPIIAFTLITIMHIVFGELAPKSFAIQRPVNTTLGIALPLHAFYLVFRPFIWLLNGFANLILKMFGIHTSAGHEAHHSSEELQYLLDQGKESGALDTNEHELIKNVFDFNERVVKNIMVPRTKISAIELETPTAEVLDYIIKEGYSRIPVFEDTIDKVVGIIHAKDVLPILVEQKEVLIADIIRKPYFIPETKKINDLMSEFQQKRIQIAIVLDEFGGTAGMVTLEDIVEELVGEIEDEHDTFELVEEQTNENNYVFSARIEVDHINETYKLQLPESENYETLGGFIVNHTEEIPEQNQEIIIEQFHFTIKEVSNTKIELVQLKILEEF